MAGGIAGHDPWSVDVDVWMRSWCAKVLVMTNTSRPVGGFVSMILCPVLTEGLQENIEEVVLGSLELFTEQGLGCGGDCHGEGHRRALRKEFSIRGDENCVLGRSRGTDNVMLMRLRRTGETSSESGVQQQQLVLMSAAGGGLPLQVCIKTALSDGLCLL